jgi:hypothetical protein
MGKKIKNPGFPFEKPGAYDFTGFDNPAIPDISGTRGFASHPFEWFAFIDP